MTTSLVTKRNVEKLRPQLVVVDVAVVVVVVMVFRC